MCVRPCHAVQIEALTRSRMTPLHTVAA